MRRKRGKTDNTYGFINIYMNAASRNIVERKRFQELVGTSIRDEIRMQLQTKRMWA